MGDFNHQMSSCEGKVGFDSRAVAREAADDRRKGRVIYSCRFCGHWHVGSPIRAEKKFTKRKKLIQLFLVTTLETT